MGALGISIAVFIVIAVIATIVSGLFTNWFGLGKKCKDYSCNSGTLIDNASKTNCKVIGGCTDKICCKPGNTSVSPRNCGNINSGNPYTCGSGTLKNNPSGILCPGGNCTDSLCCDSSEQKTCADWTGACTNKVQIKPYPPCPSSGCTPDICCSSSECNIDCNKGKNPETKPLHKCVIGPNNSQACNCCDNNDGICTSTTNGCCTGWKGPQCNTPDTSIKCPPTNSKPCGDHGTCKQSSDGKSYHCECDAGWDLAAATDPTTGLQKCTINKNMCYKKGESDGDRHVCWTLGDPNDTRPMSDTQTCQQSDQCAGLYWNTYYDSYINGAPKGPSDSNMAQICSNRFPQYCGTSHNLNSQSAKSFACFKGPKADDRCNIYMGKIKCPNCSYFGVTGPGQGCDYSQSSATTCEMCDQKTGIITKGLYDYCAGPDENGTNQPKGGFKY